MTDRAVYAAAGWLILATGLDLTWLFQALERFGSVTLRHLAVKGVTVALIFALVRDREDVVLYALIQTGGTALSHLLLWPRVRSLVGRPQARVRPLRHLRPSLTYFVPAVATSVYTVLDKTMLGALTGDMTQSGYYESAHKIIRLLMAVIVSLNVVVGVRTSYLFGKNRWEQAHVHLLDTFRFTCALAFPLWAGIAACGDGFAVVFFGTEFAATGALLRRFAPLLFVVGISNVLGSLYLTPAGYRRQSNYAIVTGAAVNLLLNVALIPRYGGGGAVLASLAAESVISVLYVWFSHSFVAVGRLLRIAARYAAYGVGVFLPTYALAQRMPPSWWGLLAQAAVGVVVYLSLLLVFRDPLWQVWRRLRKEDEAE